MVRDHGGDLLTAYPSPAGRLSQLEKRVAQKVVVGVPGEAAPVQRQALWGHGGQQHDAPGDARQRMQRRDRAIRARPESRTSCRYIMLPGLATAYGAAIAALLVYHMPCLRLRAVVSAARVQKYSACLARLQCQFCCYLLLWALQTIRCSVCSITQALECLLRALTLPRACRWWAAGCRCAGSPRRNWWFSPAAAQVSRVYGGLRTTEAPQCA